MGKRFKLCPMCQRWGAHFFSGNRHESRVGWRCRYCMKFVRGGWNAVRAVTIAAMSAKIQAALDEAEHPGPYRTKGMNTAWRKGKLAALAGEGAGMCPYEVGSTSAGDAKHGPAHNAWLAGYYRGLDEVCYRRRG